jgi:adenylate kinase
MHVVIFGRPGSGKSTLAERLGSEHGYVLIRTGELLREAIRAGDALGLQVEHLVKAGQLVPDALISELLERSLRSPGNENLLFDGFPRTMGQVPILERFETKLNFRIDAYLEIAVSHAAAVARMTGRRVCPVCGATYHVVNQPPKVPEVCDRDGARLEQRRDDAPEVIEVRQRIFDENATPILDHYRTHAPDRYRVVNGEQPFEAVYANMCRVLGLRPPACA